MAGRTAKEQAEQGARGQAVRKAAISGQAGRAGRKSGQAAPSAPAKPQTKPQAKPRARRAAASSSGASPEAAEAALEEVLDVSGERGGKGGLKSVVLQPMSSFGKHLAMRPHGRAVQQEIDSLLRSLPAESVLVIDFEGVEMMDYSFADEALGAIFSRLSAKEYPNRYIVLAAGEGDLAEALLENVEVALARREVAALVLPKDGIEDAEAKSESAEEPQGEAGEPAKRRSGATPVVLKADAGEWRVAGTLPQHLVETLRAVMDKQQVTVRELADELQIDSATACNNRIARLYQLRLVRREAAIVPEGGRQYFYSSVI